MTPSRELCAKSAAGDADYGKIGGTYSRFRQPDPRIAAQIIAALGAAETVLNVGAGAGSYEPTDRWVAAVEPAAAMRVQRPAHLARAVAAVAEALPFKSGSVDAALAIFSVHQWRDLSRGLAEMRRVARGPVIILTCDPDALNRYWLADYAAEILRVEASRYPPISSLIEKLGGQCQVIEVPIPLDCRDGFNEAYYGRPEMFLNPDARLACSSWSLVAPAVVARFVARLADDLASGTWDRKFGGLRTQPWFDGPLRLVVAPGA